MLTGKWGSGKTHFIKKMLDRLATPGKDGDDAKPLYVSLYGVRGPDEIGDQIFRQLHPVLSHGATRMVGAVLGGLAKATLKLDLGHAVSASGVLPEINVASLLSRAKGRFVIFDDFERAAASPVEILGYINPMVEHDECKVLIIADEERLSERADYSERKEKTIGRTLSYRADVGSAYDAFMTSIDDGTARTFLNLNREAIIGVFLDSTYDNLRLLKQFLWDFERLWKILSEEQRKHGEAMRELVTHLCASAIELRAGKLTADTFRRADALHHMRLHRDTTDPTAKQVQAIFSKYPTVRFDSTMLEPELIVEIFLHHEFPSQAIREQIARHPYFTKPADLPSWRALWLTWELPPDQHQSILDRFEKDFRDRSFSVPAEIIHVLGIGLWLSELGIPGWDGGTIIEKLKAYVDDVYAQREANSDEVGARTLGHLGGGAYGLGFMKADDPRFGDLIAYMEARRAEWRHRSYPTVADDLRRRLRVDSEGFLRDVCHNNAGRALFARVGVLKHIPPEQFAEDTIRSPASNMKDILLALHMRYEHVQGEGELQGELPWLREVSDHLISLASTLAPIARHHVLSLVRQYLDENTLRKQLAGASIQQGPV